MRETRSACFYSGAKNVSNRSGRKKVFPMHKHFNKKSHKLFFVIPNQAKQNFFHFHRVAWRILAKKMHFSNFAYSALNEQSTSKRANFGTLPKSKVDGKVDQGVHISPHFYLCGSAMLPSSRSYQHLGLGRSGYQITLMIIFYSRI